MSIQVTGAPRPHWGRPDSVGPNHRRKVALIGSHSDSILFAPYRDPSWEIWVHSSAGHLVPKGRADRYYDCHPRHVFSVARKNGFVDYYQWLKDLRGTEIWMQEAYAEIPCAKRYPIEAITDLWPEVQLRSQAALMMAHALYEGVTEVGLWGIHFSHRSDIEEARENAAQWVGILMGAGVRVRIAKQSPLCRKNAGELYAYETHDTPEKYQERLEKFYASMSGAGGMAPTAITPCATPDALRHAAMLRAKNPNWLKAMKEIGPKEGMPPWLLEYENFKRWQSGLPPMDPHFNPVDEMRIAEEEATKEAGEEVDGVPA